MDISRAEMVPNGGSAEERLHSLEEKYSALQQEYAKRTEALTVALSQLADVMKRLEDSRAWREENTVIQTDDKNVRGLLSAAEGQLQSVAMLRQQCEKEYSVVKVQSAERAALLAVAAEELRQCTADKAAALQAASQREAETAALRVKIELLETKLASVQAQVSSLQQDQERQAEIKQQLVQKVKESVSRLMDLQSRPTPRGE